MHFDGSVFAEDVEFEVDDIVQLDPFDSREADDEYYEGYMGNYGAQATQWYRDAGLLMMPADSIIDFQIAAAKNIRGLLRQELAKYHADPASSA